MFKQAFKKSIRYKFFKDISVILFAGICVISAVIGNNLAAMLTDSLTSKGIGLAANIAKRNENALIMSGGIRLTSVYSELITDEEVIYALIGNNEGKILTTQFESINYKWPGLEEVLQGLSKDSELPDIIAAVKNRVAVLEVSVPIMLGVDVLGNVTIGLSKHKIRRQILKTVLFLVVLSFSLAFVLGVVLFISSRKTVLDPIIELGLSAARFAKGDLSARVTIKSIGEIQSLVGSFNQMAEDLEKTTVSKDYVDNIIQSIINALIVVSSDGRILRTNAAACRLLGYEEGELLGLPFETVFKKESPDMDQCLQNIFQMGFISDIETIYLSKDGREIPVLFSASVMRDANNSVQGLVCAAQDITDRKKAEEQLKHDAFHDALTGLPNRALFMERLTHAIAIAQRRADYLFSLLFLDLDRFKVINDSLGHLIGDQLLVLLGQRIAACLRPGDSIARLGGDEFAILLEDIREVKNAIIISERIQNKLAVPFYITDKEIFTTASLGIAYSTSGYSKPEDMLRDADTAMYRAKAGGRANHAIFESGMHIQAVESLQLQTDLRRAVDRNEFIVYYQPILSTGTKDIAGYEALVRWKHPERGILSPADFIQTAEETGLIVSIDRLVLREACRQMHMWQMQFPESSAMFMSVNLSNKHISQTDLVECISGVLNETGLNPKSLKLEIAENVIIEDPEAASAMLSKIRELGVLIYIDDFGTGYSSLSYLHRLPIDGLKIDRSFIGRMGNAGENQGIIKTIMMLAKDMNINVIAEGVETENQLAQLKSLNCEFWQGYFFSKPVESGQAGALMKGIQASFPD